MVEVAVLDVIGGAGRWLLHQLQKLAAIAQIYLSVAIHIAGAAINCGSGAFHKLLVCGISTQSTSSSAASVAIISIRSNAQGLLQRFYLGPRQRAIVITVGSNSSSNSGCGYRAVWINLARGVGITVSIRGYAAAELDNTGKAAIRS